MSHRLMPSAECRTPVVGPLRQRLALAFAPVGVEVDGTGHDVPWVHAALRVQHLVVGGVMPDGIPAEEAAKRPGELLRLFSSLSGSGAEKESLTWHLVQLVC